MIIPIEYTVSMIVSTFESLANPPIPVLDDRNSLARCSLPKSLKFEISLSSNFIYSNCEKKCHTYLNIDSRISLSLCLSFPKSIHGQFKLSVTISENALALFNKYFALAGLIKLFPINSKKYLVASWIPLKMNSNKIK